MQHGGVLRKCNAGADYVVDIRQRMPLSANAIIVRGADVCS